MNADELVESVHERKQTELSRLGSSKSLYADTRGEMEEEAVLAAAADGFHAAAETFDGWDSDDDAVADCFAEAAATARDHYETTVDELGDHDPGAVRALYEYLATLDGDAERLGGLVGYTVVAAKKTDQLTGFFVGQASPQTSQTFRTVGDDVDDLQAAVLDALDAACDDDEWDDALDAATEAVQTAYDEYFETLEDLGVNPKPVC